MADPVTWMFVASAVVGAVGAVAQGNAASAQAKTEAAAHDYNAAELRTHADIVSQQAGAKEDVQRRNAAQQLGLLNAAAAQSGIGTQGSAATVSRESAINAEMDALNIRYEGTVERRGLLAQSKLSGYQAQGARMNAKTAKTSGYINAASSALSAGTGYYGYKASLPKQT